MLIVLELDELEDDDLDDFEFDFDELFIDEIMLSVEVLFFDDVVFFEVFENISMSVSSSSSLLSLFNILFNSFILIVYFVFPSDKSSVNSTDPSLSFLSFKADISNFTGSLFLLE